jgi:tetratricopeptide (TPR) repeat protein
MLYTTAAETNAEGISLRAQGRLPEAVAVFREGVQRFPSTIALAQNLAQTLYESGDHGGALEAHEFALGIDPGNVASHLALYELLQITGDRAAALEHQRRALERQRLFTSLAPAERRSILIVCAPGDWQANIPVDFLFDRSVTTVHKLYLVDDKPARQEQLPRYDVAWNTIAESPESNRYLEFADRFLRSQERPFLNRSARVLATARTELPRTLGSTSARIAPVIRVDAATLRAAAVPLEFPIIARPVGSHAGYGLERVDDARSSAGYVERNPSNAYFVSPFVDYRSADGYFRKYRIVFVDGEPYPVHLAISQRWMIHYYNAPMSENAWMRTEEERFLRDLRSVFDGARYQALREIAQAVDLEYFGIDCAIDAQERVLVFEADAAMLVHVTDPIEGFPYKHKFIPRVFSAVEAMIDRRKP